MSNFNLTTTLRKLSPFSELIAKPSSRKPKLKRNVIEDDEDEEAEEESRDAKKLKTESEMKQSKSAESVTTLTEDDILPSVPFRAEILAGEENVGDVMYSEHI